jgi:hypothetical protein
VHSLPSSHLLVLVRLPTAMFDLGFLCVLSGKKNFGSPVTAITGSPDFPDPRSSA